MSRRIRILAIAVGGAAVGALWVFTFDGMFDPADDIRRPRSPTAILGGYRMRWFAVNLALTDLWICATAMLLARRRRLAMFRIAAVHLPIALVIGLLELSAFFGVDFVAMSEDPADYSADERLRWSGSPNEVIVDPANPDLVHRLRLPGEQLPVDLRRDDFGLRNPRTKSDARILCLGDSFIEASLLPIDDVVTERLERALGVPVMNVGENGYSLQEELIRVETLKLDLKNRLVIQFVFEGNDVSESHVYRQWIKTPAPRTWPARAEPRPWPARGFLAAVTTLLQRPRHGDVQRRAGIYTVNDGTSRDVYFYYDAKDLDRWQAEVPHVLDVLSDAHASLKTEGADYAVVFLPTKLTILHPFCAWPPRSDLGDPARHSSDLRARVAERCRESGIPFADMTGPLRAAAKTRLPFIVKDSHLNAYGHETLCEALAPWIRQMLK